MGQSPLARSEGTRAQPRLTPHTSPSPLCCWTVQTTMPQEVTHLAVLASVAQGTYTPVCAQAVHTGAPVEARMGVTLIDFCQAEGSCKAQWTLAGEGIDSIHTSASIETGAAREEEER